VSHRARAFGQVMPVVRDRLLGAVDNADHS
jgi:hypothetical protein